MPEDDTIPVRINATEDKWHGNSDLSRESNTRHVKGGGDAISSGYVYRGKAIPALQGKYIFGDISTGSVWYVDYKEMLAADAAKSKTPIGIPDGGMHPVKIRWAKPGSSSAEDFASMAPITELAYHARGGTAPGLPGFGAVAGGGRSDIHFWADSNGELYIISKSDGMIRMVAGAMVESPAKSK